MDHEPLDSSGKVFDFSQFDGSESYQRVRCLFDDFLNQQQLKSPYEEKGSNPCRILSLDGGMYGIML